MDAQPEPDFHALTNREIIAICRSVSSLPSQSTRNRQLLLEYVNASSDDAMKDALRHHAALNREAQQAAKDAQRTKRLRKAHEARDKVAARTHAEQGGTCQDTAKYLELPSEHDINRCYQAFYDSTGNVATATAICAICARETMISTSGFNSYSPQDVPNADPSVNLPNIIGVADRDR